MKSLTAFLKKEWMEWIRTGRITILGIIFLLLGIMNPAIAKLTPWMMEMMADTLEESGFIITNVQVDALTSWTQFFKNIPIGLIVFVLICSGIFTKEYQSGALVLVLTKGLKRSKVVAAKTLTLIISWTVLYWLCYGITYLYNSYFWDNSVAKNLVVSATYWWLFGVWVVALMVLFSILMNTNTGVLTAVGGVTFTIYLIGMIPKIGRYLPTKLMETTALLSGIEEINAYGSAVGVTLLLSVLCIFMSFPIMNKKQI